MSDTRADESTQTCQDPQACDSAACDSASGCCQGSSGAASSGCCGGAAKAQAPLPVLTAEELEQLPTLSLIARFRRGIENFDRRVFELDERQIDMAFLPDANVGQWPIRVLIGHVADADLAAIHRMRRAVAEDQPVLALWDENAFVDANIYGNQHDGYADSAEGDRARVMQSLGGHMAVIHTLRQWTGQWLLTLSEEQLNRAAMHPERGEITVRRILAMYTWHLEHHARFLTKKLDRILGPAPVQTQPKAGGCGCR